MQAVVAEAVVTEVTHAEAIVEAIGAHHHAMVIVVDTEATLAHVMAHLEKVVTKVIVTAQAQAHQETAEILVLHALQVVIEERAVTLLQKKVQAQEVILEHHVPHEVTLQEHLEVMRQERLVAKVLQAALQKPLLETLTKKTNV